MMRIETDILVVGGGPAGLSAALAAAKAGAKVDLIDAGTQPGGQYWMQDPVGPPSTRQQAEGAAAARAAIAANVTIHSGAEVWAAFPEREILANGPAGPLAFRYRALIVASGAYDRVMPFPGWTLPGVMTPGAGQRLAKLGGTAPGRRIALAGNGPFLYAVAATLRGIGATPAMLVEAGTARCAPARLVSRHPARWAEALQLLAAVRAIRDRRRGFVVTEALGGDRVQAIRIAPISHDGAIDTTRTETISGIDALLIGWGFRPMIELTALLRCRHAYDRDVGGWYCSADAETGRTSIPGIYAAGEVTGIAGAAPARLSGALAGIAAAADLGLVTSDFAHRRAILARRLQTARAFGQALGRLYPVPESIATLVCDETIVCRCEDVRKGDIRAALSGGTKGVAGAKLWTRAGMGRCQGRICGFAVAEIVAAETGTSPEAAGFNPPRIPLRPVPLNVVLAGTREGAL
ncbi:NADPH-dependent 2,4-dienoyl-CoA reductase, sulfur reductase [Kaistia soli DSM 19436]|uniref:NADPH-dependent 2,4-dienoyl-CoA reductase, sulfur reductase n=1 Tax=Kaistia soli DSM 19436 TaxID=1122133 RepID=A0A1M5FY56_9HYPH|nr:NAD(P)/FAD-dependent oxidoreductase [Kaistia soli]SHF96112.1 NADPH-dependent 2,4-dienoyl-CoA reductase, sulfur reductase [Kaistia soli DSM 19436]